MLNVVSRFALANLAAFSLFACGGSETPPPMAPPPVASASPAPTDTAPPAASASPAPATTQEAGHKMLVLAASCWLGGEWADALAISDGLVRACEALAAELPTAPELAPSSPRAALGLALLEPPAGAEMPQIPEGNAQ